jgi:5'-phosphate synthase pdxT subunit
MAEPTQLRVGVLALQGDYEAHGRALSEAAAEQEVAVTVVLVRKPEELRTLDGLVVPGGESTTFLKFLERDGFLADLQAFVAARPTFGTCAGTILLAKEVFHPAQTSLAVLDAAVERNAYGRQNDSTIEQTPTTLPGGGSIEAVYIRAPRITRVGDGVTVLAVRDGFPVLIEQGHLLAATFHPELSLDRRVHGHFLAMIDKHAASQPETSSAGSGKA